jgi:hypothetical protein
VKNYKFNKKINGINFRFDLDLRPHTVAITIVEIVAVIGLIIESIRIV